MHQPTKMKDGTFAAWLREQRADVALVVAYGRILPVDDAIATRCAHLHIPDRRNEVDALIAATALVHGLTVATRNVRDFEGTGVVVVNPWVG